MLSIAANNIELPRKPPPIDSILEGVAYEMTSAKPSQNVAHKANVRNGLRLDFCAPSKNPKPIIKAVTPKTIGPVFFDDFLLVFS